MFGFRKKEKKPLFIMAKDVMEIIKSDYEKGMMFTLIEFTYHDRQYTMGSIVSPLDAEERKENIVFVFEDMVFQNFEEFGRFASIENTNIYELEEPIEITKAGIVGNDVMLKTPWGDRRLEERAIQ